MRLAETDVLYLLPFFLLHFPRLRSFAAFPLSSYFSPFLVSSPSSPPCRRPVLPTLLSFWWPFHNHHAPLTESITSTTKLHNVLRRQDLLLNFLRRQNLHYLAVIFDFNSTSSWFQTMTKGACSATCTYRSARRLCSRAAWSCEGACHA